MECQNRTPALNLSPASHYIALEGTLNYFAGVVVIVVVVVVDVELGGPLF